MNVEGYLLYERKVTYYVDVETVSVISYIEEPITTIFLKAELNVLLFIVLWCHLVIH